MAKPENDSVCLFAASAAASAVASIVAFGAASVVLAGLLRTPDAWAMPAVDQTQGGEESHLRATPTAVQNPDRLHDDPVPATGVASPRGPSLEGDTSAIQPRPVVEADPTADAAPKALAGADELSNLSKAKLSDLLSEQFSDTQEGRFLRAFYAARHWVPQWVANDVVGGANGSVGLTPRGHRLLEALDGVAAQGLDSQAYRLGEIRRLVAKGDLTSLAQAEIRSSAAAMTHLFDLLLGQTRRFMSFDKRLALLETEERLDGVNLLANAGAAPDAAVFFAGLAPDTDQYGRLIAGLANTRAQIEKGAAWGDPIPVEGRPSIKPGERDDRLPALRKRLLATGDLVGPEVDFLGYDAPLILDPVTEGAVRQFQARHGLATDGVPGAKTIARMNVSPQELRSAVEVALERWRLLPRDLGGAYVLVNVPQFELFVMEGRRVALTMPVAVGREGFETPLFSDSIKYMEFNPYWNVPISIAQNEVIPKQVNDPDYLAKTGFTVVTRTAQRDPVIDHATVDWSKIGSAAQGYRLRQEPGPKNPLGTVKFMFPNKYAVYLHDTNSRYVFSRSDRAVSHGCIRVGDPKGLADYLLANNAGLPSKVADDFKGASPQIVRLKRSLSVHLAYITAWGLEDGSIRFSQDVYGKDPVLRQALLDSAVIPHADAVMAAR
ncbi:L,D-transpeptidase family protein [Rhodospirillum sp. A1_3_36]|uniref:L,D-transpeptidase family protein n=1 Tax=Rhodospirillum sp. A1_3_36 TaxID=3391666 RepID=UPI0039A54ED0